MTEPGLPNYLEIPVSDLARAADFFESVFGWTARRDDGPYWGLHRGDGRDVAALERTEPLTPHAGGPLTYVMVDDLDRALKQVETLGGAVDRGRTAVPGEEGFYALVRDLDGNRFGIWSRA